jgi:uncharacterized protein YdaT
MDLFATPAQPTDLNAVDRQKAVALLQALLTEGMAEAPAGVPSTVGKQEAGDE